MLEKLIPYIDPCVSMIVFLMLAYVLISSCDK